MKKLNRILAILFSLGFIFLAILIVVELIFERAGAGPAIVNWHSLYDWMATHTWNSRSVRIIGGLCALGGLVLLGLQLIPRKKERLKVSGGRDEIDAAIDRRSVVRTVQQAVGDLDGISQARVALHGNKVTVDARRRAEAAEGITTETVADATHRAVDELHLRRPPKITVKLATARER
ncbi:hypothetical protein SAMN05421812_101369 [Asanoa hainanensis]|uniref:DUF6286 domain-containing protein n=1 Tax=Asanoa hainanensis TaxID=560556 RepID=A0A239GFM4_9ACTN|nr:DUF6286 domain-containing protein [Asanoa hainanensis]SNS67705.1 hypothetical protein SAMN05421812_101369 [Asanoa hainanensis]